MTTPDTPGGLEPTHAVTVVDGRFSHAECSCGWRTAARRDRRVLRAEARDHALLYAGVLDVADVEVPDLEAADVEA